MVISLIVSPSSRPLIGGMQTHYKPGDMVNISCICPDSFPAANISWFINGSKVNNRYYMIFNNILTGQLHRMRKLIISSFSGKIIWS